MLRYNQETCKHVSVFASTLCVTLKLESQTFQESKAFIEIFFCKSRNKETIQEITIPYIHQL